MEQRHTGWDALGDGGEADWTPPTPDTRSSYHREGAIPSPGWVRMYPVRETSWEQIAQGRLSFGMVFALREKEKERTGEEEVWRNAYVNRESILCTEGLFLRGKTGHWNWKEMILGASLERQQDRHAGGTGPAFRERQGIAGGWGMSRACGSWHPAPPCTALRPLCCFQLLFGIWDWQRGQTAWSIGAET